MVEVRYLLAVEILARRNKNRLDTNRSPKEQETDKLFSWIMSRLEWSVENCCPAKEYHSVTVSVGFGACGHALLKHGEVAKYLSEYAYSEGEKFYDVMEDVANIFNEIGKSKGEYKCGAKCILPEYITEAAELTVYMKATV